MESKDLAIIETLKSQIRELQEQTRKLQDIEEIKKLQRSYAYYLEHWMSDEIIDCFSDGPDVALEWLEGTYLGIEGVIKYFNGLKQPDPAFLHQLMPVSSVIDIAPDGKTALGRWYAFGALAVPMGKNAKQFFMCGTYENTYVKEDGKWKIQRVKWNLNYEAFPKEGMLNQDQAAVNDPEYVSKLPEPDIPPSGINPRYPSGYIFPFHYKHPVTGKKTTEDKHNASLGLS
jgi:hypothetical protein